jgi:hypothetical protein
MMAFKPYPIQEVCGNCQHWSKLNCCGMCMIKNDRDYVGGLKHHAELIVRGLIDPSLSYIHSVSRNSLTESGNPCNEEIK